MPTILEVLDIDPPLMVKGVRQEGIAGTSLTPTFVDAHADEVRPTQYFECYGSRAIYHQGWKAVTYQPIAGIPADGPGDPTLPFVKDQWELYNIAEDFSECRDLAAEYPDKLLELIGLWFAEAGKYNVLPLHSDQLKGQRPKPYTPREMYVDQLASAYQLGMRHELPDVKGVRQVVIAGMGGSAIGADLLASYCASLAPLPVSVHRDNGLPLFARGAGTLVICSSHSGNTEETLDAFDAALQAECRIMAVCTGGELARRAREGNIPVWTFEHQGQPRAAVGFSFGLLLALFERLGFTPDQKDAMQDAVASMKMSQDHNNAQIPAAHNPAKRYAGQLMGRWVV